MEKLYKFWYIHMIENYVAMKNNDLEKYQGQILSKKSRMQQTHL